MPFDMNRARPLLRDAELKRLLIEELGWEPCSNTLTIYLNDSAYPLTAIAEKKSFVIWQHISTHNVLPDNNTRIKIERKLSETSYEHIIVFLTADKSRQLWMWVRREPGRPLRPRTFEYSAGQPGDALLIKLQHLYVSIEEEERGISITSVSHRARSAFDVERVTKRFYDRFKKEHTEFLKFIDGIPIPEDKEWYASVMLNRLMFLYFMQKKGFLDGDPHYLRNRLKMMQVKRGRDKFYSFYRYFLLRLFHEGLGKIRHSPELEELIGKVPYINGGIFDIHPIEERYGKDIQIPDKAFEAIFNYFDEYDWVLDPERSERNNTGREEINPDILGYIFEKYVNQKQMGAYYTKEDITEYISKNTIIPFIFDTAKAKCKVAFENPNGPTIWSLLKENPDRYIYPAVRHGITWDIYNNRPLENPLPLPENIAQGLNPPTLHNPVREVNSINDILTIKLRRDWNKPAPPEYALPTEIWREVIARRKRYEEIYNKLKAGEVNDINDLITYNLDIRQFAQDVITNAEGPELIRAFWNAIKNITVLDPTCGSGAFLFAALNILEPLYEACLDRMEEMLRDEATKHDGNIKFTSHGYPLLPHKKMEDFSNILETVASHPNRQYFIFKSIILNNLYGVDIMEEAVEICKLRLFLKLAAQVDPDPYKPNFGIEPLPDIDFNIRAGNTLVGFARYEDVLKSAEGDFIRQLAIEQIKLRAADLQQAFDIFRKRQTEGDCTVPPEHKQEIQRRLKALEDELNLYLAIEYGTDISKKKAYEHWLKTHQPFHWFIEFYGIVHEKGGFDVIIGNPPYVEYNKVKSQYTIKGYQTESCGNLYAFVVERGLKIVSKSGRCGMIVPVSLTCSERMIPIRNFIMQESKNGWFCNFAIRPQPLFPEIMQRNNIFILQLSTNQHQPAKVFSTNYIRWSIIEREYLFPRIRFEEISHITYKDNVIPKVASKTEGNIIKMIKDNKTLIGMLKGKSETLYFHDSGESYWTKALLEKPIAYRNNKRVEPSQWFNMEISIIDKPFTYLLLNSNLLYWLWTVHTDCRHMTKGFIEGLPVPSNRSISVNLVERLQQSYLKNTILFEKRPGYRSPEIKVQNFKPIIDEIDCILARHYGFTEEELDFIVNYDIKYRMGRDGEE